MANATQQTSAAGTGPGDQFDAIIIGVSGQKDSRICLALFHVMIGRVGIQGAELLGVIDGSELGDIEGPVREIFFAECVVNPDV